MKLRPTQPSRSTIVYRFALLFRAKVWFVFETVEWVIWYLNVSGTLATANAAAANWPRSTSARPLTTDARLRTRMASPRRRTPALRCARHRAVSAAQRAVSAGGGGGVRPESACAMRMLSRATESAAWVRAESEFAIESPSMESLVSGGPYTTVVPTTPLSGVPLQ